MGQVTELSKQLRKRFYDKKDPRKREMRVKHDLVDTAEYIAAYFDFCLGLTKHGLFYESPVRASPKMTETYKAYLESEKYFRKASGRDRRGITLG
jgi:hypothetical protein